MATFTETESTLAVIASKSGNVITQTDNLIVTAQNLQAALSQIQSTYQGFAVQVDADALANPTDAEWQRLKTIKDKYVADFQTVKTRLTNIVTALTGL